MTWFGFNNTDFMGMGSLGVTRLRDFQLIRDFGFNFVRIPLNYRLWRPGAAGAADKIFLSRLDEAVAEAIKCGLHVCLAMHRMPGYTVSREGSEPGNLWQNEAIQQAFAAQWEFLAERYATIGPDSLSFNLINEPGPISASMSREDHDKVARLAISTIRHVTADRTILLDGLNWGREPHPTLLDTQAWQCCRGYDPFVLTHFGTGRSHPHAPKFPSWPMTIAAKGTLDGEWLRRHYNHWLKVSASGINVHCGEMGCSPAVPHSIMLRWMDDLLIVFNQMGIGFALWNFRGPYGVLDSGRAESCFDERAFGKLDHKLLALLQRHAECGRVS